MTWGMRAAIGFVFVLAATSFVAAAQAQDAAPRQLGGRGEATIYQSPEYSGAAVGVSRARPDLGLAWRVGSIRIDRGVWELCSRANFEGSCQRYDASRPRLPAAQRRVQSIRPLFDGGWELVGEREVRDQTERDTMISWGHTRHRRMRICVEGHAVRFYDVEVVFFLEGNQNIPVRALIGDGQCTRDIDLNGARDLSFVNMTYETFSLGHGTATVQVFARR